jgi:hypothetical protein
LPPSVRRILGVLALLAGLAAAFWQSRSRTQTVDAALLLSHIAVSVDGVVVDRERLTDIGWRVADHEPKTWNWQHFSAGQAPEVTAPVAMTLPNDATQLEIACRFQLLPGTPLLRTQVRIPVPAQTQGVVPVDVEGCGSVVR